jgi:hypothetical protein
MQRQHVRVDSFSCPFNGGGRFVLGPWLSHRTLLPSAPLQPAEHALEHPPQLTVSLDQPLRNGSVSAPWAALDDAEPDISLIDRDVEGCSGFLAPLLGTELWAWEAAAARTTLPQICAASAPEPSGLDNAPDVTTDDNLAPGGHEAGIPAGTCPREAHDCILAPSGLEATADSSAGAPAEPACPEAPDCTLASSGLEPAADTPSADTPSPAVAPDGTATLDSNGLASPSTPVSSRCIVSIPSNNAVDAGELFINAVMLPLEGGLLQAPPRPRARRREPVCVVPRRSDRLAAKAVFRDPNPEKQAKRVLVNKWENRPDDAVTVTPDDGIAVKFHAAFGDPSTVHREAMRELFRGTRQLLAEVPSY